MSFRVCLSCGELWHGDETPCPECGNSLIVTAQSLTAALKVAVGIDRDARMSADDRDTIGEVCAAYNRLEARVEVLEAETLPSASPTDSGPRSAFWQDDAA